MYNITGSVCTKPDRPKVDKKHSQTALKAIPRVIYLADTIITFNGSPQGVPIRQIRTTGCLLLNC
jgi:hypothetical protein